MDAVLGRDAGEPLDAEVTGVRVEVAEFSLVAVHDSSGSGVPFGRNQFNDEELCTVVDRAARARFVEARLARLELTAIDVTNLEEDERRSLTELAARHHCPTVAIAIAAGTEDGVATSPETELLTEQGFQRVICARSSDELTLVRVRLPTDRREDHGPFDIIGDVHGCYDELHRLLEALGYELRMEKGVAIGAVHPEGRKAVFVGDLADRGPRVPDVFRLVMGMVEAESGLSVCGNHDIRLMRRLEGRVVSTGDGLAASVAQIEREVELGPRIVSFLRRLRSHYVLAGGALVVAHAGLPEDLQGRSSRAVHRFAVYGDARAEARSRQWASEYRGARTVVYGHHAVGEAEWTNDTLCVDTGCVFGGRLTALRYPERELVSVPAAREYYPQRRRHSGERARGGDAGAERARAAAELIEAAARIEQEAGLSAASLERIGEHLLALAGQRGWFPRSTFDVRHGAACTTYLLAADPERRITLHVTVTRAGWQANPHRHRDWAVMAMVEGSEEHVRRGRPTAATRGEARLAESLHGRQRLAGESAYVLMPDDPHAVSSTGTEPSMRLTLSFANDAGEDGAVLAPPCLAFPERVHESVPVAAASGSRR